ncbi:micrococcal nuclease-like nuclease [Xenococcus sp. PCC 7305]|uniref:thermonuclease family protein n=1 Tax=Xenococcus sp. PCC 7305 TaxID=102125 RepID=UPI0002AC2C97|nr:thermonuclease family protein [Xenococcus sp. PCC 7305]ELS05477.1 micrococcal nuclease-like nuclease [Xenococcus sp. PCC 7305]
MKTLRDIFVGGFCVWLLWGCYGGNSTLNLVSVQVERVVSGQTLEVMFEGELTRARIVGIELPNSLADTEKRAAKHKLAELVNHGTVQLELETESRDPYNRLLTHVWHNDALVSEELLKEGYVMVNSKYPNKYSQDLIHAQEYARILGYGIWATE